MLAAPLVGLVLGLVASGIGWGVWWWTGDGSVMVDSSGARLGSSGNALIAALACVGTLAAATRGLHLDGLADTADGLGSAKPAEDALRIMKASDIGPFGVVTLILTLGAQTYLLADMWQRYGAAGGAAALIVASMTGRLAVTWACRAGVPSARPDGLGAWVAGSVNRRALTVASVAVLGSAVALGVPISVRSHLLLWPAAVVGGVAASGLMLRHAVRRFGGITGDVLGALAEIGFTAALLVLVRA
jgi:adenosylcobinamide-GDP ribazoletransferase